LSIESIWLLSLISRSWGCADGMGSKGVRGGRLARSGWSLDRNVTRDMVLSSRRSEAPTDPQPAECFEVGRANGVGGSPPEHVMASAGEFTPELVVASVGGFAPEPMMASRHSRIWMTTGRFCGVLSQHSSVIFQTSNDNPATSIGLGFGGRSPLKINIRACTSVNSENGTLPVNS